MEIGVKVLAENYQTGEKRHILSAYFTFVALDENKIAVEVPQVIPDTSTEKRRYIEAGDRRDRRRKEAEERRASRENNN